MADEIIEINKIQVGCTATNWQEAIAVAAQPLVKDDSIDDAYIQAMITSVNTLGPYIVLMPGLALAHAEPSELVKKTDLSIGIFTEPIDFYSEKGLVQVVICLACTDKNSHLEKLQNLAQILMDDEEIISKISRCISPYEVKHLFELKG